MTSSTVRISTKIITWIYNNAGKIVLQRRYYSYQRIFLIHEYGVWLEIGCIRRFFFTAVSRVTIRSNVILVSRLVFTIILRYGNSWMNFIHWYTKWGQLPSKNGVCMTQKIPHSYTSLAIKFFVSGDCSDFFQKSIVIDPPIRPTWFGAQNRVSSGL